MGLFDLFKKKKDTTEQNNVNIVLNEESFMFIFNRVMEFLDAYSIECPGEWYHLFISQKQERCDYYTDGYLEFHIMLGSWWDGLLYDNPELETFMKEVFTVDSKNDELTYNLITGRSTGCAFPSERINAMLQGYLDNYEAKHPTVKFLRYDWGAKITKNL